MPGHVPVLLSAVLTQLQPQPNENVVDATLGGGGHAAALLEAIGPHGHLIGIEADPRTLAETKSHLSNKYQSRFIPVHGNFRDLKTHVQSVAVHPINRVLLDLGLSSLSLADADRGFSFQSVGPLDMRFDPTAGPVTAAEIVNTWSVDELSRVFRDFGQERAAQRIAEHLVNVRPFQTTTELATAVEAVVPRRSRIHPATKVFQALRMAVNDELGVLQAVLPQALEILAPGGRLAVITFHSLEDTLVKRWSKEIAAAGQAKLINKHVIVPERDEQVSNPRSRSAKLRIIEKI